MRVDFLLAQTQANFPLMMMFVIAGVLFVAFIGWVVTWYKLCPSNQIMVVFGAGSKGKSGRPIHGGGAFVWPVLQQVAYLSLEPIQIEIPLKGALSAENIRVNVPSVFTVAIGTEPETMQNAAIRLLGLRQDEIREQASDVIFGQLRQVIASMKIEEINRDRDIFLEKIQENLEPELLKFGLRLINVNITDITDDSGYIEAIGRKAASTAIQQAEIDVAEQVRYGAIGVARAQQEKSIQVANAEKLQAIGVSQADQEKAVSIAQLEKDRDIGTRDAEQLKAVRVAELEREEHVGVETARFEQQARIKEAEQETRVRMADADALAIEGENEAKAKVAASNSQLSVKRAEAYQLAATSQREAEASVAEAQYTAEAKAALAMADKVEAERRAALEAPAKAEKAKILVEAEATAERARLEAEGEAKALFAKLEAEARGQYEILSKKAEGLGEIVSACGGSQEAFQLLMLEHMEKLSENAAAAIANIKFDKVIVWDSGSQGTSSTANFLKNMAGSLPPMMQIMQEIGGVEMPEYFGKMTNPADSNGKEEHVVQVERESPEAAENEETA